MKKALIVLYILFTLQTFFVVIAFGVNYEIMKRSFFEAGKSIGSNLIKICDERYVLKQ